MSLLSSSVLAQDRAVVTALSGSAQHIQAAVDIVAADPEGGDVHIPAGTWNFIEINGPWETVYVPPGVNIFGAGMIDENIVFDETDQTSNWRTVLKLPYDYPTGVGDDADIYEFFVLDNPDKVTDKGIRLSGFAIVGYRTPDYLPDEDIMTYPYPSFRGIYIYGVVDFRIDHMLFRNTGGGVDIKNNYIPEQYGQGVIDHCKFINTAGWGCAGDHPRDYPTRTVGYGVGFRLSWNADFSDWEYDISKVLGKYNRTVFIEDCYFQRWRHCICGNSGGHMVFRYNTINLDCAYGSLDAHEDYAIIGTRALEIYNNTIENPCPEVWFNQYGEQILPDPRASINMRGGGGVFFNNTITDYRYFIEMPVRWTNIECKPHDIWMWDNTIDVWGIVYNIHSSYIENVDFWIEENQASDWTRQDNSIQLPGPTGYGLPSFWYTPYPYPHPLTLEGIPIEYLVNITGIVTDSDTGLPIQGATVSCGGYSDTTNSTGGYFIMTPLTAPGSCTLTASRANYTTKSIPFPFTENKTYERNFILDPIKYSIAGRLIDIDNNPVQANIIAYQETAIVNSTNTDSLGNYDLSVSPGTYDIQFNLINFYIPNYYIKIPSVDVSSNVYDLIKYVTGYSTEDKVSIMLDIDDPQTIQTYSDVKPMRVLQNGANLTEVNTLPELVNNKWFYENSIKKKLHLIVTPWPVPDCGNTICEIGEDYTNCPSDCPLELSLVGGWNFDEGSGSTATDSSDNNNDGTIYGATWIGGKIGTALDFDGTNDYVYIPHSSSLNIINQITTEAWVKKDPGSYTGTIEQIVDKAEHSSSTGFGFFIENEDLTLRINKDSTSAALYDFSPYYDGNWHHVAGVYNTTHTLLYVDGELKNSNLFTTAIATNTFPLYISNAYNRYYFFNGTIDEVRIYNRSLTAEEILAHASA